MSTILRAIHVRNILELLWTQLGFNVIDMVQRYLELIHEASSSHDAIS